MIVDDSGGKGMEGYGRGFRLIHDDSGIYFYNILHTDWYRFIIVYIYRFKMNYNDL